MIYYSTTLVGSSGCPIFNLTNNKVIAMNLYTQSSPPIHIIGIAIKYLVKEYLKIFVNK